MFVIPKPNAVQWVTPFFPSYISMTPILLCPADPMPGNRPAIIRYQHLGALTRLVGALDFPAAQGSQTLLRRTNP
jgi:hypothetical protein